jgi:hypothetical protein
MSTLSVLNTIIPASESLSDPIDCSGGNAVRITFPTTWTGANLTFQISTDGNGYNDLVDTDGREVMMTVVPGAAMHISAEWSYFWNFIKIRSGSSKAPVIQKEQRDFAITLHQDAAAASTGSAPRVIEHPRPSQRSGHLPMK